MKFNRVITEYADWVHVEWTGKEEEPGEARLALYAVAARTGRSIAMASVEFYTRPSAATLALRDSGTDDLLSPENSDCKFAIGRDADGAVENVNLTATIHKGHDQYDPRPWPERREHALAVCDALEACISETIRLHRPVLPLIAELRQTCRDLEERVSRTSLQVTEVGRKLVNVSDVGAALGALEDRLERRFRDLVGAEAQATNLRLGLMREEIDRLKCSRPEPSPIVRALRALGLRRKEVVTP